MFDVCCLWAYVLYKIGADKHCLKTFSIESCFFWCFVVLLFGFVTKLFNPDTLLRNTFLKTPLYNVSVTDESKPRYENTIIQWKCYRWVQTKVWKHHYTMEVLQMCPNQGMKTPLYNVSVTDESKPR